MFGIRYKKTEMAKLKCFNCGFEYQGTEIEALRTQIAKLKAENDDIKQVQFPARVEKVAEGWRTKCDELKRQLAEYKADAERLRSAGNLVVETHNEILPIMSAYMGTLGTTNQWQKTCVSSDALREALATTKTNTS